MPFLGIYVDRRCLSLGVHSKDMDKRTSTEVNAACNTCLQRILPASSQSPRSRKRATLIPAPASRPTTHPELKCAVIEVLDDKRPNETKLVAVQDLMGNRHVTEKDGKEKVLDEVRWNKLLEVLKEFKFWGDDDEGSVPSRVFYAIKSSEYADRAQCDKTGRGGKDDPSSGHRYFGGKNYRCVLGRETYIYSGTMRAMCLPGGT